MTNSNSQESTEVTVSDLVVALNELRDALVNASLMMQDIKFELDSVLRSAAIEHSNELMEKVKALG
jgi:hypothetical protein